jgi:hypothetical protein
VDKWPAYARLSAVAQVGHLSTAVVTVVLLGRVGLRTQL